MKKTNIYQNTFFLKLHKSVFSFLLAFVFQISVNAQGTEFDWTEKIQLYGHGFKVPTQFTDEQLEFIANKYKIFTVEKRHAYNSFGGNPSTEKATIGTAAALKAINPDIKVLLYWNSVMNYSTLYESNIEFNNNADEWTHSIWNTGYEIYDLENPDCQDWWVNSIVKTIEDGNLDGVFLDAGPKVNASGLTDAYNTAVDRVRARVGDEKIIIYNGFRVNGATNLQAGQEYIEHQSGVFIEFFLRTPCDTKEEVAFLFDNCIQANEAGKMIVPRGTPLHYLEGAPDPFLFNFASFLLIYGPNSYYHYNRNGYAVDEGILDYYPEYYDIATGKPWGSATRNGWVYTREFDNLIVTVDLLNVTASIEFREVVPDDGNLALKGSASQSSTDFGGVASRAIDNNTDGAFGNKSVTHTLEEENPWWQVDLGSDTIIGDIEIFGRTDECCASRLSDYTVYVINSEGNITYYENLSTYPEASTNAGGAIGQIIKIVLNGTTALSLAEVKVYAAEPCEIRYDAFSTIQAEDFCEMSGVQLEDGNDSDGTQHVAYIHNGDNIRFGSVDFGVATASSVTVRVASKDTGGTIEIRSGSSTGELLASIPVVATGSWTAWESVSADISPLIGKYDLYFVFTGGDGYLFNLNWIAFSEESTNISQSIELQEGWNLISLYIQPNNNPTGAVFPNATIVKTFDSFYSNSQADFLNTLTKIEAGKGYLVYNEVDETITISGVPVKTGHALSLQEGWNLIGVPSSTPLPLSTYPDAQIIKDFDSFYEKGSDFNSLTELQSGRAFFIYK